MAMFRMKFLDFLINKQLKTPRIVRRVIGHQMACL